MKKFNEIKNAIEQELKGNNKVIYDLYDLETEQGNADLDTVNKLLNYFDNDKTKAKFNDDYMLDDRKHMVLIINR